MTVTNPETTEDTATPDGEGTTVEVTVTPPETVEPEPAAEVVVVEAGGEANPATEAVLVDEALDTARALAGLSVGLDAAVQAIAMQDERLRVLEERQTATEQVAEAAVEIAVAEPAEPEPAPVDPEQDSTPDREHGFFRPLWGKR